MCHRENETDLKQLRGMEGTILERAVRLGFFKEKLQLCQLLAVVLDGW